MRRYKEQCEALVKAGAIILVRDGFTEGGIPVYVTRKVTGCFGVKRGRDSEWGVTVDYPFEDGADGVFYELILGVNVDGKVEMRGVRQDIEKYARSLSNEEWEMILSDAMARLKMADEEFCLHEVAKFFINASHWKDIAPEVTSFLKHNGKFQDSIGIIRKMTVRVGKNGKCLFSVDNSASLRQPNNTTPDLVRGHNRIFLENNDQIVIQIPNRSKIFSIQIQVCQESLAPESRLPLDWT